MICHSVGRIFRFVVYRSTTYSGHVVHLLLDLTDSWHLCTQWYQQTQTTMACGSHMLGIRGYALIVRITSPVALGQAVVPLNHQVHRSENLSKRWQPTAVWRSCHNTSTEQRCWVFTSLVLVKEWAQYILNTHPTSLVLFSDNIDRRYLTWPRMYHCNVRTYKPLYHVRTLGTSLGLLDYHANEDS